MIEENGRVLGCGVIVLFGNKILLGRRSDGQGWCLAGGKVEEGETSRESARRELEEEFGIVTTSLDFLGTIVSTAIVRGVIRDIRSSIFVTQYFPITPTSLVPNDEITDFMLLSVEQILDRSSEIFRPTLEAIHLFRSLKQHE